MPVAEAEAIQAEPTISEREIVTAECDHCRETTVQVLGGTGVRNGGSSEAACLQCIADGGNCCSLAPLNRHAS